MDGYTETYEEYCERYDRETADEPRRLVVDDMRVYPFPAEYCRSLEKGLAFVTTERWDEVYLDHDLGGEDTIRPLVAELERAAVEGNPYPLGKIYITTANPVAAMWMRDALQKHYDGAVVNIPCDTLSLREAVRAQREEKKLYA